MPEIVEEKRDASIDYMALESMGADFGIETPATLEPTKTETPTVEEKDLNEIIPEVTEIVKEEEKKPEEVKTEVKTEEEVKEPVIELKVEDVDGFRKEAEDGTWKATGEFLGVDVAEETPEAFKAAIEAKYTPLIEEAKKYSLEQEYAKLKPETVTALKLIEMGYPEDQAFNPTARHSELLKMDDAALVRIGLEGREGWDEDRVNMEMESLSERPELLKHEALKAREWLNNDAKAITSEREALVNQYTENREKAVLQQREQESAQIKEAVMSVESFMGAKINPEAKSAMAQKYSRGDYGDIFKDGKSMAEYLYFKEFGNKILNEVKTSSYARGKEEYTKEMLRIPTKPGEVAGKIVQEKIATNNQQNKNDAALGTDFG